MFKTSQRKIAIAIEAPLIGIVATGTASVAAEATNINPEMITVLGADSHLAEMITTDEMMAIAAIETFKTQDEVDRDPLVTVDKIKTNIDAEVPVRMVDLETTTILTFHDAMVPMCQISNSFCNKKLIAISSPG